ncbi:succinate dehydrogenase [ubiquinone] iron-sulfur subunit-like [Diorhabda carinulata]|nr:succinate dehydrogenase [ubiquinone] iron-sulfur subunit-like [Diorhabda carinulata]XP_057654267.1 succinate dehydrogenase [ubiquinone] iron-sulfur subunit-like [Diorhabda carinulata]
MGIFNNIFKICLLQCSFLPTIQSRLLAGKADAKKLTKKSEAKKKPRLKTFNIYRYDPERKGSKPFMKKFTIDLNECRPTVLDALNKIKTEQDTTLTFRKSCREGICGSCGMNIDGVNRLACLDKIKPKGVTKVYPLPHMYVIKDLVVDFHKFMEQHNRIKPFLIRDRPQKSQQFLQSIKDRDNMIGLVECILCACCSTSCPEYWWHGHSKEPNDFLGPAALLNSYRWITDSRDHATEERLNDLKNYFSVFRCHQINNCTVCCPKRLVPGKAIAKLRLLVSGMAKKKKPDMEGTADSDPMKACEK